MSELDEKPKRKRGRPPKQQPKGQLAENAQPKNQARSPKQKTEQAEDQQPDEGKAKVKEKKKRGRPTKFTPQMLEDATDYARLGMSDEEIARVFNVWPETIVNWKKKHPEFFQAIKEGREGAGSRVAKRLFNRACGYSVPETKVFCHEGKIITHEVIKHYPPETAAAVFFLKNRFPDLWADRREIEQTGEFKVEGVRLPVEVDDV